MRSKAFKAVLLRRKAEFPFTHDLADAGIDVPTGLTEADALTPSAVETRDPGFWGESTPHDVHEAIRPAKEVLQGAEVGVG